MADERQKDPRRVATGRLGAHVLHSRYDSRELTAPGRAAFLARFDREVDPDGILDPVERARRAAHARSAYMSRLILKRWGPRRHLDLRDLNDEKRALVAGFVEDLKADER